MVQKEKKQKKPASMPKRLFWMLLLALVVFGGVFGIKAMMAKQTNAFFDSMPQPASAVTDFAAKKEQWADAEESVGTFVAINGTDVTTEAGGIVRELSIKPGQPVKAGTVLVQLNTTNEVAVLRSLEAAAKLAVVQRDRWRALGKDKLVSQAEVEERATTAATTLAQAEAQRALIAQKTIRAPFSGVLGLRKVNLGQYVNPGDPIVSIQSLDPIFLDFSLPEQRMGQVLEGTLIRATVDALPGQAFEGKVTAIEPLVDTNTRNFKVQATLPNPENNLRPGTFAHVNFDTGGLREVVVIPQTAVSFNPYGNAVYVISQVPRGKDEKDMQGKPLTGNKLIVKQRFIKTGATRGDLIAVTSGLKPGERVATSGLLKLRNDAEVTVNNKVQPTANAAPTPENR
ncbi:efflux RND transporter periplasmic adaptor subunit [Pseudoxanthomonas sacheonensis]|uniref:efflux RND transporter periplasmic adaptor subunit n=1 Tax=Pseudoxanthomonas sacheonensis TaxID=443615 RepID=UPI0013D03877|nr:efflux RND transporter periplasmic adaptor subunit [Pseudoxanthomonas sacheonensis]KAF1711723.1 efflux transporter periplasmic adaptor subunit [Pseudoxanthomonas sacheonensis]